MSSLLDMIERLNVLSNDVSYEVTDEGKIRCRSNGWKKEFQPPVLFEALEDVYGKDQMELIVLGAENGAR